jgi:predicted RND superfamily exporter protein
MSKLSNFGNQIKDKYDRWNINKTRRPLGIVIVVCAIAFLIFSFWKYKSTDIQADNNTTSGVIEQNSSSQQSNNDIPDGSDNDKTSADTNTNISNDPAQNDSSPSSERSDDEIVSSDFMIQGLSDDLLTLINQDQNGLSAELQEALYTNGYYDYSTANVDEWYVKDGVVSIDMTVDANKELDIEAEYDQNDQSWYIRFW